MEERVSGDERGVSARRGVCVCVRVRGGERVHVCACGKVNVCV